jgi:hypothetical protein
MRSRNGGVGSLCRQSTPSSSRCYGRVVQAGFHRSRTLYRTVTASPPRLPPTGLWRATCLQASRPSRRRNRWHAVASPSTHRRGDPPRADTIPICRMVCMRCRGWEDPHSCPSTSLCTQRHAASSVVHSTWSPELDSRTGPARPPKSVTASALKHVTAAVSTRTLVSVLAASAAVNSMDAAK